MKIKSITIFEHESLRIGEDDGDLSESEYNSLLRFHEIVESKFFYIERRKIKFRHYVGIIQIGTLVIEVLPKVDKNEGAKSKWHDALLKMIKIAKGIKPYQSSDASVKLSRQSLLDIYFEQFLMECRNLMSSGFRKKYSFDEGNLTAIKGKILFSQNLKRNLSNKAKVFCRHQVYDFNHDIHAAIKMALVITKDITRGNNIVSEAKRLLIHLPDPIDSNITLEKLERIKLDRTTKRYEKALNLASLIIKAYCPTSNTGKHAVIALMFDMNKLYEEFVFNVTKSIFRDTEYEVLKRKKKFWEGKEIRPDIVITNGKKTVVIDTKWKVPKDGKPADDDLKQIYVYNHYFESPVSFLLYPNSNTRPFPFSEVGKYHLLDTDVLKSRETYCLMESLVFFNQQGEFDLKDIGRQIQTLLKKADFRML